MTDTGSVTEPITDRVSPAPAAAAGWHLTHAGYPADATVPGLFAAQAASNPDATALVFGGESVSYAELDRRSNALAWLLRRRGVGTDVPVGVAMERGTGLVGALLAVLKAGGAYLPIEIGIPAPRVAGRADRKIKIRGYRIESGEVEAALRGHGDIAQAVVSLRGGGHDVRLVGYLVTRSGAGQPPGGLREHRREMLPDYMVPAAFVVLPALPLTGSGKVDYRALPEPDWGAASGQAPVAARTPTESKLAAIVAELLALPEPVGVSDNFFALGGHSLTATQLMARIRAVYGVDLPIRTLFSDPTVAGLAAALAGDPVQALAAADGR